MFIEKGFFCLAQVLNLDVKDKKLFDNDIYMASHLSEYMKLNHYIYTKLMDINVPKNQHFLKIT